MEQFKPKIEELKQIPSFATKTKEILKNARLYVKIGVSLLVFSLGEYKAVEAQNIQLDNFSQSTTQWFNGNISTQNIIEKIKNNIGNDTSYLKLNINQNNSSLFEKNVSGKNPFSEEIKIGGDTNNLGNITIGTFGAGAIESDTKDKKENITEYWEFSSGVKKAINENNNENGKTKIFTTKAYGDNPTEIILSALGEMSGSKELHVFNATKNKTQEKENNITENFKTITASNSENTFKMVKAVITETSKDEYSVTVTYIE
ncbi:MAG: hypothetical protein WCG45_02095 [bacterium]